MQFSSFMIPLIFTLFAFSRALIGSLVPFVLPKVLDQLRASRKMEEFIKHLGIPSADLCHPATDDKLRPMFNKDLPFGDVILDAKPKKHEDTDNVRHDFSSDQSTSEQSKDSKSKSKKTRWEDGVIPYYISNDFTDSQREKLETAISGLNSKLSNVKFREFEYLSDQNYLYIFSGKGCYSKVGMVGGQQPVSLQADKCLKNGVIQHELTHAIGFCHEQNRPDRNDYIKLLKNNIPESWLEEYERNNPSQAAFIGEYDYFSIMHYPTESPGDTDRPAFKLLDRTVDEEEVGNKDQLSDLDVQKIDEYYGD